MFIVVFLKLRIRDIILQRDWFYFIIQLDKMELLCGSLKYFMQKVFIIFHLTKDLKTRVSAANQNHRLWKLCLVAGFRFLKERVVSNHVYFFRCLTLDNYFRVLENIYEKTTSTCNSLVL